MFNPIQAAEEIKNSYIDYITTTFDISDGAYKQELRKKLTENGMIASGPYLDIGGSYETGHTIRELVESRFVSPLFEKLEPIAEEKRELKLERALYCHQETALLKANAGENLVITTGTGSGKTESFLLPIINHLLCQQEAGTLDAGVRAIIIYPMNALANDQMKRMRALFRNYPQICYGVYNGNTEHAQSKALEEYRKTFHDEHGEPLEPMENEIISREVMQKTPPHILITNYSMLEYMMLRPKDDRVFSGAKLKFIVLDEAHIYKGATGMETSLLMRRLRARISEPDSVQYILTSATLGGPEADDEILSFANKLCGVPFNRAGIVRSKEKKPDMLERRNFPMALFEELQKNPKDTKEILARYQADFAPDEDNGEKLYALFLHSQMFAQLRSTAKEPVTIAQICSAFSEEQAVSDSQIVAFIDVCAKAEKDGASLIKPRYHFFVRALEGAYITLNKPQKLFLQRKHAVQDTAGRDCAVVFEAAVCTDCGRIALVGKEEGGFLHQSAKRGGEDCPDFYYIKEKDESDLFEEEEEEARQSEGDEIVCPICGAIGTEADGRIEKLCEHDAAHYVKLRKVTGSPQHRAKCPACGFGEFRRFYLGSEAATAVLGTELFDQLPAEEVVVQEKKAEAPQRHSIFGKAVKPRIMYKKKMRQFLCFSDSRSEAAFFASYMERSYEEFLRRRGIWHVAQKMRKGGRSRISVWRFVDELSRLFEENRSFAPWDSEKRQDADQLAAVSKSNAWVAILNEMFNARRGTSLVSMGVIAFEYRKNQEAAEALYESGSIPQDKISSQDTRNLMELLVQDAVFAGAVHAGKSYTLTSAEREYIFFAPTAKKLVKMRAGDAAKRSWVTGWCGRKRTNGNYYPNGRILRLKRALGISDDDANELLDEYWEEIFAPDGEKFALDANDFDVCIGGTGEMQFYRCRKCGRITPYNVKNQCANVKCTGVLESCEPLEGLKNNHYAKLYSSQQTQPLYIKEHTAQLAKEQQTLYQEAFVQKKINALSCSTTFEMGVDVGSLETVYMRDVPPSPANYVQRAGRAGRSKHASAFVMTYAKLSSHDFTYYQNPVAMISGKIKAPIFEIENEKIINRHIFAVAFSAFLAENEDVYAGDDQTVLLNENGYERLKAYLGKKPQKLKDTLMRSIPQNMHKRMGIEDFGWTKRLCGENGTLEIAVQDFRNTVEEMKKEIASCRRKHDDEMAGKLSVNLRRYRCAKEDNYGKKSLISFLVRNNVLPKYGFPVDTVELIPEIDKVGRDKSLQLARDLQMAIAEYAPGAEVVADGKMYVSRYIRKMPGKNGNSVWEEGRYCIKCPNCGQPNFTKEPTISGSRECVSCHKPISKFSWRKTLEPRMGFCAEKDAREVPLHRPEHDYKTDDYYIGDPYRNIISERRFQVQGQTLRLESTSNDSLVVIGQTRYKVCAVCGYAHENEIPLNHKNVQGYPCTNKEGKASEYYLSHDFKTDVVKITFETQEASDRNTMLSVLYALLEGLSREMGIERTDIKGCLFSTMVEGKMVDSIILYDAVAGGAGHVRRMVTENGDAFQRVLARALSVVDGCDCGSSCYKCLRNYYNQKIHDRLNRRSASEFLHQWLGQMEEISKEGTIRE